MSKFLPPHLMNIIFQKIKYEIVEKDEAVFYQGDLSKKFYIIIEGRVDVYVMCKHCDLNSETKPKKHK